MHRSLTRMRFAGLARGIRQWRDWVAEKAQTRRQLRAILMHWRGQRIARALAKLKENAARRQLARIQATTAMAIWRNS